MNNIELLFNEEIFKGKNLILYFDDQGFVSFILFLFHFILFHLFKFIK